MKPIFRAPRWGLIGMFAMLLALGLPALPASANNGVVHSTFHSPRTIVVRNFSSLHPIVFRSVFHSSFLLRNGTVIVR